MSNISNSRNLRDEKIIRHRAFRHRWSALMLKSCFWRNLLSCLKGPPPSRRDFRKHPQTLFRLFFLMSKNQAHKLQNGSLGDPKITKKTRKMRSGMECGKDWKKTLKNRSPGTLKIMVLLRKVAKKTTSTLLQKTQEMESKINSKSHKNP